MQYMCVTCPGPRCNTKLSYTRRDLEGKRSLIILAENRAIQIQTKITVCGEIASTLSWFIADGSGEMVATSSWGGSSAVAVSILGGTSAGISSWGFNFFDRAILGTTSGGIWLRFRFRFRSRDWGSEKFWWWNQGTGVPFMSEHHGRLV